MAAKYTLPVIVDAPSWPSVVEALFTGAQDRRGRVRASDGTLSPPLSNQEAVAIIDEFRDVADKTSEGWPLWYQFAAVAYDWDTARDRLDSGPTRGNKLYPVDVRRDLWVALMRVAGNMQAEHPGPGVIHPRASTFGSLSTVAAIRRALNEDGAEAAFKIPTPACKERDSGKKRLHRVPCDPKDADGWKRRKRKTFYDAVHRRWVEVDCDRPGDCENIAIDDPITAIGKSLLVPILVVGGLLWLITARTPRSRRGQ